MDLWRSLAIRSGLPGLFLAAEHRHPDWDFSGAGFDAIVNVRLLPKRRPGISWKRPVQKFRSWLDSARGVPAVVPYGSLAEHFIPEQGDPSVVFACVLPNWDNTPRSGANGVVLDGATPELFRLQLRRALAKAANAPSNRRILFVKSWNEWAEGNHLEPDLRYGRAFLDVLKEELLIASQSS